MRVAVIERKPQYLVTSLKEERKEFFKQLLFFIFGYFSIILTMFVFLITLAQHGQHTKNKNCYDF